MSQPKPLDREGFVEKWGSVITSLHQKERSKAFFAADLDALLAAERERCARAALEQRCERNTPWDRACVAIAAAIRAGKEGGG